MLIFKYAKAGSAVYMPHLMLLRTFSMAIRRCGLSVRFSEGFSPHERIFFAPPLPIGTASECEYFAVDSSESPEIFMEKLNGSLPPGIQILKAAACAENPNFAAASYAAEYEIITKNEEQKTKNAEGDLAGEAIGRWSGSSSALPGGPQIPALFNGILAQGRYEIAYEQKGETVTKDVRGLIFNLSGQENRYLFTLACGNPNLRADRLMSHLLTSSGGGDAFFTVTKKRLFDKNFADIDELFFSLRL